MTPRQRLLVRETWQIVVPIADSAAQLFYDRLFAIDPTTRPLFRSANLAAQRDKLMRALAAAIAALDRLETLVPALEDLGRRHVRYGVVDRHYESVGAALLWTLERGLGTAWTGDVAAAWAAAYQFIAGTMRRAATGAARAARGRVAGAGPPPRC